MMGSFRPKYISEDSPFYEKKLASRELYTFEPTDKRVEQNPVSLTSAEKKRLRKALWVKQRLFLERGEEDDYDAIERASRGFLEAVESLGIRSLSYLDELLQKRMIDRETHAFCAEACMRTEKWNERIHANDLLLNEEPSPFFLRINEDDEAFEQYERNKQMCESVKASIEPSMDAFASTARAATILNAYKEAKKDGEVTDAGTERAMRIGGRLSEQEYKYGKSTVPLPTIGIEIEVPDRFFTAEHLEILRALGMPCYRDTDNLNEVNPGFSYSPWVQARILQDLVEVGMIPLEHSQERRAIPHDVTLPLHINFGSEHDAYHAGADFQEGLSGISDIFIFAFSSPKRVLGKGYGQAYNYINDAKPSSKTGSSDTAFRLELRASEFSGQSAYRLLTEAQSIVGMLFAYQKQQKNTPRLTKEETTLAKLWPDFFHAIEDIREAFQLEPNMASLENEELARKMENPLLREAARRLIARYARKVQTIVFP